MPPSSIKRFTRLAEREKYFRISEDSFRLNSWGHLIWMRSDSSGNASISSREWLLMISYSTLLSSRFRLFFLSSSAEKAYCQAVARSFMEKLWNNDLSISSGLLRERMVRLQVLSHCTHRYISQTSRFRFWAFILNFSLQ